MKRHSLLFSSLLLAGLMLSSGVALGQAGGLDHGFGDHGLALVNVNNAGNDNLVSVAVYPSSSTTHANKVVLVGDTNGPSETSYETAIIRLTAAGEMDTSFNGTGKLTLDMAASAVDFCQDVAIQSDDKIVVLVQHSTGGRAYLCLIRINADGTLDNTFGTNGVYKVLPNGLDTYFRCVAIQNNGAIVVGGESNTNVCICRVNTTGTATEFYSTDMTTFVGGLGTYETIKDITFDNAGSQAIYATGFVQYENSGKSKTFAVRFNSNGAVAWRQAFDYAANGSSGEGIAYHDFGGAIGEKLLIGGGANEQGTYLDHELFAAAVLNPADGTFYTDFDTDGKWTKNVGGNAQRMRIGVQSDHKIVLGGDSDNDLGVVRFDLTGAVDATYGSSGVASYTLAYTIRPQALALDSNDKVVASFQNDTDGPRLYGAVRLHPVDKAMAYVKTEVTQETADYAKSQMGPILALKVCVDGVTDAMAVSSFTFNTTGSTDIATDVASAALYYTGTSGSFDSSAQLGATVNAPSGEFTISGFSQALAHGDQYFWLVYQTTSNPTLGDTVDAQCTSVTVGGNPETPAVTAPAEFWTITAAQYPEVHGDSTYDEVNNVTFDDIDNTTENEAGGYGDYTAQEATVTAGQTYGISITNTGDWPTYPSAVLAYFDWNGNASFDDPGEKFVVGEHVTAAGPHTMDIEVPAGATAGSTRLRVISMDESTPHTNKGDLVYGEAEDYTIVIEAAAAAPAAPSTPGATSITTSAITWTWADNSSDETGFKVYADAGADAPTTLRTTTAAGATSWQQTTLSTNAQYTFQVAATNVTGDSDKTTAHSAWTAIEAASGVSVSDITSTSMSVASSNTPSNLTSGTSGLYFANTTAATNSGWQQNNTPWSSSGLSVNTQYTLSVKSRNGAGTETTAATVSKYTLALPPSAPTVGGATVSTLGVAITAGDGNPADTGYAIKISPAVATNTWVQADGSIGASAVYQTRATWGTKTVTGLAEYTQYTFTAYAANGDAVVTAASDGASARTSDTTAPTGTISVSGGAAYATSATVTLTLSASDGSGSGVAQMQFSNNNTAWSGWEDYGTSKSWTLSAGDGAKTVYVQYKDTAGNVSSGDISDGITLDATVPVAGTLDAAASVTEMPLDVSYTGASDAGTGLAKVELWYKKNAGGTWTDSGLSSTNADDTFSFDSGHGYSGDGTYYFKLVAQDTAGNRSAAATGAGDGSTVIATRALAITAPNGGESWRPRSTQNITWTTGSAAGATVKIKLFKNNRFVQWIVGSAPNNGSFSWTLPADLAIAADYKIQVYSATDTTIQDLSDSTFSVVLPQLQVLLPNGGEQWYAGIRHTVTWNAHESAGDTVRIKLFKAGVQHAWIAGATANDGAFEWRVPEDTPIDDDYTVQLYSIDDFSIIDSSNAPFSVNPSPICMTHPNGREQFKPGDTVKVTWTSDADVVGDYVKLKLFKNNVFNQWVSGPTPNDGLYVWTVPADLPLGDDYTIQVYSAANLILIDYSDQPFSCTESRLRMTRPEGGETWLADTVESIEWDTAGINLAETVQLALYKGGVLDRVIAGPLANTGAYDWTIPADITPGTDYGVRVAMSADADVNDRCDIPLAIKAGTIEVTQPNGREIFAPDDVVDILWTPVGNTGPDVDIALYKLGVFDRTIATGAPNTGAYSWTVPDDVELTTSYTVTVTSGESPDITDVSDAAFSIAAARLRVLSPDGDEEYAPNQVITIQWDSVGATGTHVKIKLMKGNRVDRWISGPTPNDGAFAWRIPATIAPGADYRVQLYSDSDFTIIDYSDAPFSIAVAP